MDENEFLLSALFQEEGVGEISNELPNELRDMPPVLKSEDTLVNLPLVHRAIFPNGSGGEEQRGVHFDGGVATNNPRHQFSDSAGVHTASLLVGGA